MAQNTATPRTRTPRHPIVDFSQSSDFRFHDFLTLTAVGYPAEEETSNLLKKYTQAHSSHAFEHEIERLKSANRVAADAISIVTSSKTLALKLLKLEPKTFYVFAFLLRFYCREMGMVSIGHDQVPHPIMATLNGDWLNGSIHLS